MNDIILDWYFLISEPESSAGEIERTETERGRRKSSQEVGGGAEAGNGGAIQRGGNPKRGWVGKATAVGRRGEKKAGETKEGGWGRTDGKTCY